MSPVEIFSAAAVVVAIIAFVLLRKKPAVAAATDSVVESAHNLLDKALDHLHNSVPVSSVVVTPAVTPVPVAVVDPAPVAVVVPAAPAAPAAPVVPVPVPIVPAAPVVHANPNVGITGAGQTVKGNAYTTTVVNGQIVYLVNGYAVQGGPDAVDAYYAAVAVRDANQAQIDRDFADATKGPNPTPSAGQNVPITKL